jgi:hypothetical protein
VLLQANEHAGIALQLSVLPLRCGATRSRDASVGR